MLPDWFWLCVFLFGSALSLGGFVLAVAAVCLQPRERRPAPRFLMKGSLGLTPAKV